MRITVGSCQSCGQEFRVRPTGQNGGKPHRFCSRTCANLAQRTAPTTRTCVVCGVEFRVGYKQPGVPTPAATRCSVTCRRKGKRGRPWSEVRALSVAEAAYLAGLIDGEGSIGLHRSQSKNRVLQTRVTVANTYKPVLDWCREVTGAGSVNVANKRQGDDEFRWKTAYVWVVSCGTATAILQQIAPYMIIKTRQAELAMSAQTELLDPARKSDPSWQDEYHMRMKELNRRGGAPVLVAAVDAG